MDPMACLDRWLAGDKSAARDYNEWIGKRGFPARVKTFHPRMFGVMVFGDVVKLGRVYAYLDGRSTGHGTWKVHRESLQQHMGRR